jgi:hypothetical protein
MLIIIIIIIIRELLSVERNKKNTEATNVLEFIGILLSPRKPVSG